jgi:hypothetical protein
MYASNGVAATDVRFVAESASGASVVVAGDIFFGGIPTDATTQSSDPLDG